jgi:hypothetical protein
MRLFSAHQHYILLAYGDLIAIEFKVLMPTRAGPLSGCWTCRLRRKKCDGFRPVCRACTALEIVCHSEPEKPEWMDDATKQREMREVLKRKIKMGTTIRREARAREQRRHGEMTFVVRLEHDYRDSTESISPALEKERENNLSNSATSELAVYTQQPNVTSYQSVATPLSPGQVLGKPNNDLRMVDDSAPVRSILDLADDLCQEYPGQKIMDLGRAWEMDFVMMYLDHVFPFLFPFYRPHLVGTGRTWLLTFLKQSDSVFHSATSLSAYFFIVRLGDEFPGEHDDCKTIVWDQVVKQAGLSIQLIQKDLRDVQARGKEVKLLEKAHLMENIIQLLIFDTFLGRSANWQIHLKPAITLFEDLFKGSFPHSDGELDLGHVLGEMVWDSGSENPFGRPIWNPDQSGFRFFAAILIFIDIVASTALGKPPKLKMYHSKILGDVRPQDVAIPIDLSSFVGCHNWVLVAIAEISTIDAWKRDMKNARSLSIPDLVQQTSQISQSLADGLERLERTQSASDIDPTTDVYSHYADSSFEKRNTSFLTSQIWAYAAQIYLFVVVSGWQPAHPEVHQNVEKVLKHLQQIKSPARLRALAWPICVAGCLAEEGEHEGGFRNVMARAVKRGPLNTLNEVKEVMEAVWKKRNSFNCEAWDITASLGVLGSPVLLV